MSVLFYTFFKGFYLFIFRDRESEGERERNINVWLTLTLTLLGTWPATQASALTGNWTGDPLVHRPALSPLSYTSQGPDVFSCLFMSCLFPTQPSTTLLLRKAALVVCYGMLMPLLLHNLEISWGWIEDPVSHVLQTFPVARASNIFGVCGRSLENSHAHVCEATCKKDNPSFTKLIA